MMMMGGGGGGDDDDDDRAMAGCPDDDDDASVGSLDSVPDMTNAANPSMFATVVDSKPDSDDDDDVSKYMIPPDDDEPPEAPEPEPEPEPAEAPEPAPEPEPEPLTTSERAAAASLASRYGAAAPAEDVIKPVDAVPSGDDVGSRLFNDVFSSPAPAAPPPAAAKHPWKPAAPPPKPFDEPDATTPISVASFRKTPATPPEEPRGDGAWRPDAASPRGFEPVALPEPGRVSESHKRTVDTLAGKFEEKMKWERRGDDPVVIHKTPSKKVQTLHKALSDLDLKSPAVVEQRARAEAQGLVDAADAEAGALVPSRAATKGYSPPPPSREMKAADSDEEMVEFDFVDFGLEADMVVS